MVNELRQWVSIADPHSCLSSITQMVPDKTVVEKVLIILCTSIEFDLRALREEPFVERRISQIGKTQGFSKLDWIRRFYRF